LRIGLMAAVCWACWPQEISRIPRWPLVSILIGIAVFAIWIGPDVLIPGYRSNFLFSNSLVGHLHSSLSPLVLRSPWLLTLRVVRAVVIVPIVEELFWRGWMMRWLINTDFRRVSLGSYSPFAFWVTAVLFASEHGPYWDVGLITGIIYNGWMIRSKSIASCILMHAVTNGLLCAYVIATSQWQYWQ
jgi:CAAX prenyl protease-like protein